MPFAHQITVVKHNWSQKQIDHTLTRHGLDKDPGLTPQHFLSAGHEIPNDGIEILEVDYAAEIVVRKRIHPVDGEKHEHFTFDEWKDVDPDG